MSKSVKLHGSWKPRQVTLPIIYFSGHRYWKKHGGEDVLWKRTGWGNRCFSFAYLDPASPLYSKEAISCFQISQGQPVRWLIDSGAFSFRKTLKTTGNPEDYLRGYLDRYSTWMAALLANHGARVDFYANFDYVADAKIVYKVQRQLEKLGLRPIPVYHGDSSFDWLRRYFEEGHKLVALSRPIQKLSPRRTAEYYATCFSIAEKYHGHLHGFAQTGSLLFRFPWYSVDSTSWLLAAVNGQILEFSGHRFRMQNVYVSTERVGQGRNAMGIQWANLAPQTKSELQARAASYDLDWKDVQTDSFYRAIFNVRRMQETVELQRSDRINVWPSLL